MSVCQRAGRRGVGACSRAGDGRRMFCLLDLANRSDLFHSIQSLTEWTSERRTHSLVKSMSIFAARVPSVCMGAL